MTLVPEQLYRVNTESVAKPRMFPRENGVRPGNFAAGTALLPIGTPVVVSSSTGKWLPYVKAGANDTATVRGFVYPDPIQLVAGGEVVGQILRIGDVDAVDVTTAGILAVLGGAASTAAEVKAAMLAQTPSLRELNIELTGLTGVK